MFDYSWLVCQGTLEEEWQNARITEHTCPPHTHTVKELMQCGCVGVGVWVCGCVGVDVGVGMGVGVALICTSKETCGTTSQLQTEKGKRKRR